MNRQRLAQAADWLDQENELSEQQHTLFLAWMNDPENAAAYQQMKAVMSSDVLETAFTSSAQRRDVSIQKQPVKYMSHLAMAATVACLGVLVYFISAQQPEQPNPTVIVASPNVYQLELESPLAQRSSKVLIDGTQSHLNANSAVKIQQNTAQRHALLISGQVYFDVAKDPDRPFVIDVGQATVTVLGTAFDIDYSASLTTISVYEGHVQVTAGKRINLTAGQTLKITNDDVRLERDGHLGMLPSWRSGWLEANDLPLAQVVEKLQRYLTKPVELSSPELKNIPIVGRFSLDDPKQALTLLASAHQLALVSEPERFVLQNN